MTTVVAGLLVGVVYLGAHARLSLGSMLELCFLIKPWYYSRSYARIIVASLLWATSDDAEERESYDVWARFMNITDAKNAVMFEWGYSYMYFNTISIPSLRVIEGRVDRKSVV